MRKDGEPGISAADIVDIESLRRLRKQNKNMPEHLKAAIGHMAGGSVLNRGRIGIAAKSLGVTLQRIIHYGGGDKTSKWTRRLPLPAVSHDDYA